MAGNTLAILPMSCFVRVLSSYRGTFVNKIKGPLGRKTPQTKFGGGEGGGMKPPATAPSLSTVVLARISRQN